MIAIRFGDGGGRGHRGCRAVRVPGSGLREQDAGSELIAVECEAPPQLEVTVQGRGPRDVISGQQARFDLQLLVRDGNGRHWRLRGRLTCAGERLDTHEPAVGVTFDLASAEAV